jgi:hypothetical protein
MDHHTHVDALIALLVVPHGLTDAWALPPLPTAAAYASAAAATALCPDSWLPHLAAAASTAHFAGDHGLAPALALMAALLALHATARDPAAYALLLAYMLAVHLPRHYARVAADTPAAGWTALLALAAASWAAQPLPRLRASPTARRLAVALVAAHTAANLARHPHAAAHANPAGV